MYGDDYWLATGFYFGGISLVAAKFLSWEGHRGHSKLKIWVLTAVVAITIFLASMYWIRIRIADVASRRAIEVAQLTPTPSAKTEPQPTMDSLFKEDFPSTWKYTVSNTVSNSGKRIATVKRQVYCDMGAKADFVGFLIDSPVMLNSDEIVNISKLLVDQVEATIEEMKNKLIFKTFGPGDQGTDIRDLLFTGRVVIYYSDGPLSPEQVVYLRKIYRDHNMPLELRGPEYLAAQIVRWQTNNPSGTTKRHP